MSIYPSQLCDSHPHAITCIGRYGSVLNREAISMASRRTVVEQRFRLRQDLLDKLRRAAEAADRSLNEETELRLMDSFTKQDITAKAVKAAMESLRQTFEGALEEKRRAIDKQIEDAKRRVEELLARAEPRLKGSVNEEDKDEGTS
jgi:hypothetical protein